MNSYRFYIVLLLLGSALIYSSCKSDGTSADASPIATVAPSFSELKADYTNAPDASKAKNLLNALVAELSSKGDDIPARNSLLEYGYQVASDHKMTSNASGYLFSMLKEGITPASSEKIFELASYMKKQNKPAAANVLFQSILEKEPNWAKIGEAKEGLSESIKSSEDYILDLGKKLFEEVDNTGINRTAAMKYVNACEAYGLSYPENGDVTADNLFKAAEVAKSIRTFPKSLSLYDWILDKYPNYTKAPTSLFLKGFIIENNLKDDVNAREIYDQFLAKYPKHDLADDVEFLIDNLGKSDQEILEMIEAKQKEKASTK